jgi:cytochrome c biogenesis protein CcmG, thiol:disulfide interchange protein DsbE
MRRLLQAAAILLLVGLVALFAKSLRDSAGTVAAAVRDGQEPAAPDFTRDRLVGDGTVSLRDYRGRVVLLNFWASWCVPCQDETPLFVDYAARYRDRGLAVIGVNAQDFVGDARAFAKRFDVTYPLVHDSGNTLTRRWGGGGFPVTFLIDRDGRVRRLFPGAVSGEDLRPAVLPLLREAA